MERNKTAYLLAHDIGTSGNKATLFSTSGRLIASETRMYTTRYYNAVWAEQDAGDWWDAVCASTRSLLEKSAVDPKDILGVSFSGQMMGCLCVDKAGTPLYPAIIWADQRAQSQAHSLGGRIDLWKYYRISGHRNTASYGLQKLMWVKENQPEVYANTYKSLNAKDYVVFKLTGNFYTDYSDANGCGCLDLLSFNWSREIVEKAGIDGDKLPEVKPSTFIAGYVTEQAAKATGLAQGTPVVLGSGDAAAATVGAGCITPGSAYCCIGTSAWIASAAEKPLYDGQMRTTNYCHMIPGLYSPNGTMQFAGGAYAWMRTNLCPEAAEAAQNEGLPSPYAYMDRLAANSPKGANGLLFLPFMLGERAPYWDAKAKGCFIGLKAENTRADMLRSVLEGSAYNLATVLEVFRSHDIGLEGITALGGGAQGELWREILADVLQTPISVPAILEEASSMGAAVNAGVGIGLYPGFDAIEKFVQTVEVVQPDPRAATLYSHMRQAYHQSYAALKGVFERLDAYEGQ